MIWLLLLAAGPGSDAFGNWAVCVHQSAVRLSPLNEPAQTIADAAMAECRRFEHAAREQWLQEARDQRQNETSAANFWDRNVATIREDNRQSAIASVLDARSKALRPRP